MNLPIDISVVVILLVAIIYGASCSPKAIACPDEVYHIVLADTYRKFPQYNYLDVWLSRNYEESHWGPLFAQEQSEINRIRAWSQTLPDRCFRSHYAGWLDYYQNGLDSARNELRTQEQRKHMQAYEQDNRIQQERVQKFRESHKIPSR